MNLFDRKSEIKEKRKIALSGLASLSKILKPGNQIQWEEGIAGDFTLMFSHRIPKSTFYATIYDFRTPKEISEMLVHLKAIIKDNNYPVGSYHTYSPDDLLKFIKTRDEQCNSQKKK